MIIGLYKDDDPDPLHWCVAILDEKCKAIERGGEGNKFFRWYIYKGGIPSSILDVEVELFTLMIDRWRIKWASTK